MKNVKHEWTKKELVTALYVAKWDYNGLNINNEDIVDSVIPETTVHSLNMQIANFRYLLNMDGYKLSDASKLMKEIVDEYDGKSMDEVKCEVIEIIQQSDLESGRMNRTNRKIEDRKSELNRLEQEKYENRLKELSKYRRLVKVC